MMTQAELLTIGQGVIDATIKMLGTNWTPTNIAELGQSRSRRNWRRLGLALVRRGPRVSPSDEVAMIGEISQVSRRLEAFRSGCCGELAMFAYNRVRALDGIKAQLMKASGKRDWHAFVLLGVGEEFRNYTSISAIAESYPAAVVIDYWAVQNGHSEYGGVFPIAKYEEETSFSLSGYDLDRVKTWFVTRLNAEDQTVAETVHNFNQQGRQF